MYGPIRASKALPSPSLAMAISFAFTFRYA